MRTITGTCYFPSYGAALRYYRPYLGECDYTLSGKNPLVDRRDKTEQVRKLVDEKLNASEIHIGKPPLKPGQTLSISDNRYHITES